MLRLHNCLLLIIFLSACSQEEYTVKKNCIGRIENFDEKVLVNQVNMSLSYSINEDSIKVKFAEHEIDAAFMKGQKNNLIYNLEGNYFVHLLNQTGMIEYSFNPDKWFVGSCK
ncbi:MAG: hypothetical protein KDI39_06915 [Pseudomonadales bacterium]|nr:hypothetical protein [Pseudomonadales bacterium]